MISSLVILVLLLRNTVVPLICRLVQVDLDPAPLVVLLDLDRLLLEPLQLLQLSDPRLERCFATIVKDSGDNSATDTQKLVPGDGHDDKHDEIEESELENDEEAIEDDEQEEGSHRVQQRCLHAGSFLNHRVALRLKRLVKLLELTPELGIFDVSLTQLFLVVFTHVELLALSVPYEDFLDARRAWSNLQTIAKIICILTCKFHLTILKQLARIIAQKLRLLFLFYLV